MIPINSWRSGSIRLPHSVNLASGSVVSVRVSELLSDGRLRISLNGRMLTADFASKGSPPEVGQTARAIVRGTDSQGRVVIELPTNQDSALLRRLDLPDDNSYRTTIEAFARSGLPLDPEAIGETAQRIRGRGADTAFFARILALLKRKGLPGSLGAQVAWPAGHDETAEGAGPPSIHSRSDTGEDGRQAGDQNRRQGAQARSPRTQEEKLAESLRRTVERTPESVHPIHLFNHTAEGDGGWAVIPLTVEPFDTVTFALQRDRHGNTSRAALRIAFDSVRVQALWPVAGGALTLTTNTTEVANQMKKVLTSLSAALESHGLHVDTVNISDNIDGFSDESLGNILRTVDTDV